MSQANLIESNPFASLDQDRSYEMTTVLEGLNNAVMKVGADNGTDRATNLPPPSAIHTIIEVIEKDISSIENFLSDPKSVPVIDDRNRIINESMEKEVEKGGPLLDQPYQRDIFPLLEVHEILAVLAKRPGQEILNLIHLFTEPGSDISWYPIVIFMSYFYDHQPRKYIRALLDQGQMVDQEI